MFVISCRLFAFLANFCTRNLSASVNFTLETLSVELVAPFVSPEEPTSNVLDLMLRICEACRQYLCLLKL